MAVCNGITYNSTYGRIEVDYVAGDGTKGASFNDPYTFNDIYDTDQANGWGYITKSVSAYNGSELYIISNTVIWIYNNDTYFKDSLCVVVWLGISPSTASYQYPFRSISGNVDFDRINFDAKLWEFVSRFYCTGVANWSNLVFRGFYYIDNYTANNNNISVLEGYYYYLRGGTHINIFVNKASTIWPRGAGNFSNIQNIGSSYGVFIDGRYDKNLNISFTGAKPIDCTYSMWLRIGDGGNPIANFIESVLDFNNVYVSIIGGATGTSTIKKSSTFNVTVENASGGDLIIYDKDNNIIYSETLASDSMTEQIILYQKLFLDVLAGVKQEQTITNYYPFKITIEKYGYKVLTIPNINITDGVPTNILGAMSEPTYIDNDITTEIADALAVALEPTPELTTEIADSLAVELAPVQALTVELTEILETEIQ